MKLRLKALILSIILIPSYSSLFASGDSRSIRVAIVQDAAALSIKIKGFFEVTEASPKKPLYRGRDLKTTVTAYKDGILLGGRNFKTNSLFISTPGPDAIIIDGRLFSGSIQFIKNNNARLLVVNHVGLEDYIKGIMYHEASHYWPPEALAAQAIICRTYAVYTCQQNKSKEYDLTNDIYSQVYGGRTSERYRTNQAVIETSGQILTYQGKVIPAYYHSTCAGHTEDANLLWKIDMAPLKGVPCDFCKDSPHFNWHYVLSRQEIKDKLLDAGYRIGNIDDIAILGRSLSGRITDLKVVSEKKDFKISAKDFRNIIGPNIIRSTNFKLSIIKDDVVFQGLGWGHGVGLCQWGAYFMAKQGYTAQEILKYYYPGVQVTAYETNSL
ncbi:MAG: SpoIID/LytB domain-containing protein [Candidatus Omnitrophica bacterium]|nr:SpoIID/LytB domain-containing protein [Candidatus Omnitrophota bacterium]